MLTAGDLAFAQRIAVASLDSTLTIERPTNTTGAFMETIEAHTTIATGVPCMVLEPTVQPMSTVAGGELVSESQSWEVFVPNGTDIQANDEVVLANGARLRVQGPYEPMTSYRPLDVFLASALS